MYINVVTFPEMLSQLYYGLNIKHIEVFIVFTICKITS